MGHKAAFLAALLASGTALAQEEVPGSASLPVYRIVRSGVSETEAAALAGRLKISKESLSSAHGELSFLDAEKYLAFPKAPVVDSEKTRRIKDTTRNKHPETPIRPSAIDAHALTEWRAFSEKSALETIATALDPSPLRLQSASATVGHNVLTLYSRDSTGKWNATRNPLDTEVNYRFAVSSGHPLIGPGAQVRVTFDNDGRVSRFHYAARQLAAGPQVRILSEAEARERIARKAPEHARITMRLVYWAPPLQPWIGNADRAHPTTVIPWYAYYTTREVEHPKGGADLADRTIRSRVGMVPATDDRRYVPELTLTASADGAVVHGHAAVRGGAPPYTYIWGGSGESAARTTGDTIEYTAQVRATEAMLRDENFRVRTTERVSVTVIDANGVTVQDQMLVPVHPRPALRAHGPGQGPSYGAESPADPGEWTPCRVGWQNGMSAAGAGGGTQSFAWLGDDAWPGDFIEPNPPGTLVATPWVYGDADYANWGINTADLVIDIADANADFKTAMQPGAPLADYATAGLTSTAFPNDVNINGNGYGTAAWYTVNYANAWGPTGPNDTLEWLLTDDCDMLDPLDGSGLNVAQRWGVAFNGLHVMAGFSSLDYGDGPFENAVAKNILGVGGPALTIVQAWFSAAASTGAGTPAAMGPAVELGNSKLFWMANIDDYYWGKGGVGPTIVPSAYPPGEVGFWYLNGSSSAELVF